MLLNSEVARTFLGVLAFWFFLLFRFVLRKYAWYKICSSDIGLSIKKKFGAIRSRHHGLTVSDIISISFAPHVIYEFLIGFPETYERNYTFTPHGANVEYAYSVDINAEFHVLSGSTGQITPEKPFSTGF